MNKDMLIELVAEVTFGFISAHICNAFHMKYEFVCPLLSPTWFAFNQYLISVLWRFIVL